MITRWQVALSRWSLPLIPRRLSLVATHQITLIGLTLASFALRLILLDGFPLREDEAIYSFWARMVGADPWFLTVWPDKPPLFIWLQAGTLALFGPSVAAARMLSIAASTLTVPVCAAIAARLWGKAAAAIAAALIAFSPFAISFAATAYTDSLLVFCGMVALYCAISQRPFAAGLWLGAAIMTKQQGLLYAPLILMCVLCASVAPIPAVRDGPRARVALLRNSLLWLGGLLAILIPILLWDASRWAVAPSPWDLGVRNYAPLALTAPVDWGKRLLLWSQLGWHLTASWPLWLLLGASIVTQIAARLVKQDWTIGRTWPALIALWALLFLASHIVTTVPAWDRYLLPLAPLLALAGAWALAGWHRQSVTGGVALVAVVALLLLPPALSAARGGLPVGADHGDLRGLDDALLWLEQEAPSEKTLYHSVLGWHYQFYLFDEVRRGKVDLRWVASAAYLADNASKTPHRRKFLIEPDWAPTHDLAFHLTMRGLELRTYGRFGRFSVLEITQPMQAHCDWCLCRKRSRWEWLAAPSQWTAVTP